MNGFAVNVDGPQASIFRDALGTAEVPVCAPAPRWIPAGDQEIYGYQVDLLQLTAEQRQRLDGNLIIPVGDAWSWGNLDAFEAYVQRAQAAAEAKHRSRYTRPAARPVTWPISEPWTVVESEPQRCTGLTVISRIFEPEIFDVVDARTIAGLHHAVKAADARSRAATMRAQMAEGRAEAMARGQVATLAWGVVLAALVCGLIMLMVI